MTNSEWLRGLSDEDMLEFFFGKEAYTMSMAIPVVQQQGNMTVQTMTTKRFIDWMKEDAGE